MSYCEYCLQLPLDNVHRNYHDNFYGFPLEDDNELFGRLIMEINQAGLSWDTILKKENNFRHAFDFFNIDLIADYSDSKIAVLLADSGIIRNKLKINAVIYNAQKVKEIQLEFGTFKNWLDTNQNLSLDEWVKLFKRTFKFVGKEIVNEFLMSTGYLPGAHDGNCNIYKLVIESKPKWLHI